MDTLSERLGLYDLWAVLFPGAIFNLICIWSLRYQDIVSLDSTLLKDLMKLPSTISEWIIFGIVSFFYGIILQEVGRIVRKAFKARNSAEGLLDSRKKVFMDREIVELKQLYDHFGRKNELNNKTESKLLFSQVNAKAQESDIAKRLVKLSVIQNMSYALCSAMVLCSIEIVILLISSAINGKHEHFIIFIIILVIEIVLSVMFFKRGERFNRFWVRNIVYAVHILLSDKNISTKNSCIDANRERKD